MARPNYKQLVDELGKIKAGISDLCERESEIKVLLVKSGKAEVDGELFRATVSHGVKTTLDADYVRSVLTPAQLKKATRKTPMVTVRVSARKRS